MPSILATVQSLLPYHLMCYGSLLGFQIYQSFINTKLCFLHLPRPQFRQLTKRVFPVYFRAQVILVILTAATYPPRSIASISKDYAGLASLSIALAMGLLNLFVFGPKTTHMMILRTQQETRDVNPKADTEVEGSEAKTVNRGFSRSHAMAIHLNAISMLATIFYGFWFSARLHV